MGPPQQDQIWSDKNQMQEKLNLSPAYEVAVEPRFNEANDSFPLKYRPKFALAAATTLSCLYILLHYSAIWIYLDSTPIDSVGQGSVPSLSKYAVTSTTPLLDVFQVYPPVLTVDNAGALRLTDGSSNDTVDLVPEGGSQCLETLVVHSFAYSYGQPFVGSYNPPSCAFNHVTWNLTVTSAGRQFDRLGVVYLGDIEVFRTSTAEPTTTGIEWVYLKDMTPYLSLFRESQKLIFDLGNLIDDTYTGAFNVTLTAAFFTISDSHNPADVILPISARLSSEDSASVFTVPTEVATNNLTFPQNILRAVFTVSATGQSAEEFWWSNVPSSNTETFPQTGSFYGYSPFREVQLLIDDTLAGVAWPFPIIFTGGVVPGLWRPIVGIDAFDLREDEIDITPWLPLLCDGSSHNFTIRVVGLNDGGNGTVLSETVGSYWLVTGKVFIWLDTSNHTTTGTAPKLSIPSPSFSTTSSIGKGLNGANETLSYQVTAQRQLSISSTIRTSQGEKQATWHQSLSFSNTGNLTDAGNVQINLQDTKGTDQSTSGYAKQFDYPLWAYTSYTTFEDNYTIAADVNRGKDVQTVGQAVFPNGLDPFSPVWKLEPGISTYEGSALSTTQNGSATYIANSTASKSFSFGTTSQDMILAGLRVDVVSNTSGFPTITDSTEFFHRYVSAVNSTVTKDEETVVDSNIPHDHLDIANSNGFAAPGVKATLGRGPSTI